MSNWIRHSRYLVLACVCFPGFTGMFTAGQSSALLISVANAEDAPADPASSKLEDIRVSADGTHFVYLKSAQRVTLWGANYDHDDTGRLIEDYWHDE